MFAFKPNKSYSLSIYIFNKYLSNGIVISPAEKDAIKRRNQNIKSGIAGVIFLIPAFIEGFIAALFLFEPFYEAFKTFLIEDALTGATIADIEAFFADISLPEIGIGSSRIEDCLLISMVVLIFVSFIVNSINLAICRKTIKKYDSSFLKFCKFMIWTARVLTIAIFVVKLISSFS